MNPMIEAQLKQAAYPPPKSFRDICTPEQAQAFATLDLHCEIKDIDRDILEDYLRGDGNAGQRACEIICWNAADNLVMAATHPQRRAFYEGLAYVWASLWDCGHRAALVRGERLLMGEVS